jgi:2-polyprenyl-3-methyl-5-hydroxy-6-metoxy-1,4-benzoquinol methylase
MRDLASSTKIDVEKGYRWVSQYCPTCEVPPTRLMGRRGGTAHRQNLGIECELWRCGSCGLIFPNPMPIPIGGLDQHYGSLPDEYFEHHDLSHKRDCAATMLQQAEALTGGKGNLLDIGAGRGELLRVALQDGWSATGIEPSSSFAEYAARYSGAEIRREPVERCRFEDNSFDVVILAAVLEHLYNPDEVIEEIARILRSGGALYLDVPNEEGLYFRVGNLYQKLRGRDWVVNLSPNFSPFHVFGFSPKSLRALLSKHGFRPEVWQVYGGKSWVPARGGLVSVLERQASRVVTALSNFGSLGTYIEAWSVKS